MDCSSIKITHDLSSDQCEPGHFLSSIILSFIFLVQKKEKACSMSLLYQYIEYGFVLLTLRSVLFNPCNYIVVGIIEHELMFSEDCFLQQVMSIILTRVYTILSCYQPVQQTSLILLSLLYAVDCWPKQFIIQAVSLCVSNNSKCCVATVHVRYQNYN